MKRLFSHALVALAAGLALRLFFVLKFPANSGDTVLYEQIALNWLQHRVYGMDVGGQIVPVDLRMPGYPAFLALVYGATGRIAEAARPAVLTVQVVLDLLTAVVAAAMARRLAPETAGGGAKRGAFLAALWLAALCPFTANYTATVLTEVLATLLSALGFLYLVRLVEPGPGAPHSRDFLSGRGWISASAMAGLLAGAGTLVRPETPLLLATAFPVVLYLGWKSGRPGRGMLAVGLAAAGCLLPLVPWAVRNAVTLREFQLLAPRNSNLPDELVPYGFMAWEKTWLFRVRDCYLVPWKLNGESIQVEDIPARAFDTPGERERVAALLEAYNVDLTLTAEEDAAFAQLARERNARHPLRTYVWLPAARALAIWFTPRIELLPVSGHVFPLAYNWEEDPVDQRTTLGFFLLNLVYVLAALWGARRAWRAAPRSRPAVFLILVFILARTLFLTTLETPEPRYVLVCYPLLVVLAAQIFARERAQLSPSGSG